jgi:hypothetical protein
MAKPPTTDTTALTVRERILLFCAGKRYRLAETENRAKKMTRA